MSESNQQPESPKPYVPITSPTVIMDMLFAEYGAVSHCPHCNNILPPKTLFGIPIHHRSGIENIVRHAIIFYQREMDRAGVNHG